MEGREGIRGNKVMDVTLKKATLVRKAIVMPLIPQTYPCPYALKAMNIAYG